MKSFKSFLTEYNSAEENKYILMDCLNAIKDDCQQYLHKVATGGKFHPLYRSIASSPWPLWEVKVRKGRPQMSTSENINDSLKRVFKDEYGNDFKTTAMFASGRPKDNAHLIFPIGKFDYLWAAKEKNLYDALTNSEKDGELYWDMHKAESDDERDKFVKAFMKDNEFTHNKELQRCADKGYEVMIDCAYYYVIPVEVAKENMDLIKKTLGEVHIRK